MADVENPNSNSGLVAAAEPSRNTFSAWTDRLIEFIIGIPNGATDAEVTVAEPAQRGRWRILCFWGEIAFFFATVGVILLVIQHEWPMGRAWRHAATVVGCIALVIGGCLASLVVNLTLAFVAELEEARIIIDLLL